MQSDFDGDVEGEGPSWFALFQETLHGIRNGLIYGAKIRLPHAAVMTVLFREGSWQSKMRTIFRLTYEHSIRLGKFVGVFKVISALLKRYFASRLMAAFVAGCIGGWLVFPKETSVNSQIILYLTARVLVGAVKLLWFSTLHPLIPKSFSEAISRNAFTWQAMLAWGGVMCLWELQRKDTVHTLLPNSLQSSMQYLYEDSKVWRGWLTFCGLD